MAAVVYPRPEAGAVYKRFKTHTGLYEEALVVSVSGPSERPEQWTGVIITRNGVELVTSSAEWRTKYDWAPRNWVLDAAGANWAEPKAKPAPKKKRVARKKVPAKVIAAPEEGAVTPVA